MSYSDFEQEKDRKLERLRERLDKYEAKLVASQKEIMSQTKGENGNNT